MQCLRCHSTMIAELFEDRARDSGPGTFLGWHCIACGAIVDPLILAHQRRRPEPRRQGPRVSRTRAWRAARPR